MLRGGCLDAEGLASPTKQTCALQAGTDVGTHGHVLETDGANVVEKQALETKVKNLRNKLESLYAAHRKQNETKTGSKQEDNVELQSAAPTPAPPHTTHPSPGISSQGEGGAWARQGAWGNQLVRRLPGATDGTDGNGRKKVAKLEAHVRIEQPGKTNKKLEREAENHVAIGGMRNPALAVGKVPGLRHAGKIVRESLELYMRMHPTLLSDITLSIDSGKEAISEERVIDLAGHLGRALDAKHTRKGKRSLWRPGLVEAFVNLAGDPETELAGWLEDGAPTGVAHDVRGVGIFPLTKAKGEAHAELWRHWARTEPTANYASVEEHRELVMAEVDRLRTSGFVTIYSSWAAVLAKFGNVVVSKMAAISKARDDGSTKLRLIIDMRRSNVNDHARLHERIVLPRVVDLLQDALAMLEHGTVDEDLDMMVIDWADAFHSIGVLDDEKAHQIVKGFRGTYIGYETVLFGGAGSPGVWGRAAAFLGRSGQSLFCASEARLQVYVDDPWTVWRGSPERRRHLRGILLLWWIALGPPLSWKKAQLGNTVKWIGVEVSIHGGGIDLSLDPNFISDLLVDVLAVMRLKVVEASALKKLAGKAEWAASIVPYLKAMVSPLWAAASDAPHGQVGQTRIHHALKWLVAFLERRRGALLRRYRPDDCYAAGQLVLEIDASPWGYGGVLYAHGKPISFYADEISEEDVATLKVKIGDHRGQAILEFMALLIAVRLWRHLISVQQWTVTVRSDSMAALGAACKLRSPEARMNRVARELALDLAESKYELDFMGHLAGEANVVADALSRLTQPEEPAVFPELLVGIDRAHPCRRTAGWWEAAGDPEYSETVDTVAEKVADYDGQACIDKLLNDGHSLESNAEETDEVFGQPISVDGLTFAGTSWDLERGGQAHNVMVAEVRAKIKEQVGLSDVVWWAPECSTFSRARGRPVPGATSWPPALRSQRHPYGLPCLRRRRRETDRMKVENGNAMAKLTFVDAAEALKEGRGIAIENPENSFMWVLEEAKHLAKQPDVYKVHVHNCMFRGGKRDKSTIIMTNVPEIRDGLSHRVCRGGAACDRTGRPHLKWTPVVSNGVIVEYPTKGEAGYPEGFCDVIAKAVVKRRASGKDVVEESRIAFTEIFCGKRALLSARVTRHLGAALRGYVGSSSSG